VVDHHWRLKNLGDMTKLTEEMLDECGPISLFCGGTPCQSFSVAGLRKGLEDPRGNLALRFTQLVGVLRPEWVVWENVPGVLSSSGGRDFGTFLGALAELGYGFAYRILDAQWFGVAQRRRRVFVVANARDWRRAAAVLFERESLFGNPPTRGAERERTFTAAALSTKGGRKDRGEASDGLVPVSFKNNMSTPSWGEGLSETLQAANGCAVAYGCDDTAGTIRSNTRNNSSPKTEAAMHVMHGMAVRRLTPKECERLQGFPDGYTDVTYRKKPAADGPRYKALGNSMAVPVMAWIGQRIAEVEATDGR
jgi:DNA (cytosine-5)-methyltransferase 1